MNVKKSVLVAVLLSAVMSSAMAANKPIPPSPACKPINSPFPVPVPKVPIMVVLLRYLGVQTAPSC